MSIRARIILSFVLLVGLGFYSLVHWVTKELRPRYLESLEESLVDHAQVLAALISTESQQGQIDVKALRESFEKVHAQEFSIQIYKLLKTKTDLRIYVTDEHGLVTFDSKNPSDEGKDYSNWNNIALTLKGQYGARTSHEDKVTNISVLHVSAPIIAHEKLIGIVTIAKPTTNINFFIQSIRPKIMIAGGLSALSVMFVAILISIWVFVPIRRLGDYAHAIRDGRRVVFPKLGHNEIGEMGKAFEEMEEALEGKKYVENYVQTLTHEIKSPLSAIQGAAELLQEDMREDQKRKFLSNIQSETHRIQDLVNRMLQLSSLESRKELQEAGPVDLEEICRQIVDRLSPLLKKKKIRVSFNIPKNMTVFGERFLLEQAVLNGLQNALEFSPEGKSISLTGQLIGSNTILTIQDEGPGIPDYALPRVFEKFYSLPRPQTGQKSTGLGLSFVQEIMTLHRGQAFLENNAAGGAKLTLKFYYKSVD